MAANIVKDGLAVQVLCYTTQKGEFVVVQRAAAVRHEVSHDLVMMLGNSSNQFAQNKGTMPPATKKLKLTLPPTKLCGSITTIPQTTIPSHP